MTGARRIRVVEDSGAANNLISIGQIKRFGFSTSKGRIITGVTLTGEEYSSEQYVDISCIGKSSYESINRFYVAPETTPIDMLVGNDFIREHAVVLMGREPTPQLPTVQSRVTIDISKPDEAIMEDLASLLEDSVRAVPSISASISQIKTRQSANSWEQPTVVPSTLRKKSSK
ncbi:hypothetical protein N0V82_009750 [Gnomoniopsis sp. IMI 355080]|nr:hypothetical protein N0V82_009750 [Gnomoniopsis sp. IMI 355080]